MTDEPKQTNPLDDDGEEMVCRDCKWYRGNVLAGICFGAPPVAVITAVVRGLDNAPQPVLTSYWPNVSGDKFCGQFRADRHKDLEPLPLSAPVVVPTEEAA